MNVGTNLKFFALFFVSFSVSCYLNLNVSNLGETKNTSGSDTDSLSLSILGITGSNDTIQDQALSSLGDPEIFYTASQRLKTIVAEITSIDGTTSYCKKELSNPLSSITLSSCSLANGNYSKRLKKISRNGFVYSKS